MRFAQDLVDSSTLTWSSPLVILDSGYTAMLFGSYPAIIRQRLGLHETRRRDANCGRALRNLVLAAAHGCSLKLAAANAITPWTCRLSRGIISPLSETWLHALLGIPACSALIKP